MMARVGAQEQRGRENRRSAWAGLGARHGLELFTHGHGGMYGVHGTIDGIELSVAESIEGFELHAARVLPKRLSLALCDRAFRDWCREPGRVRAEDAASRAADRIIRVKPLFAAHPAILHPHRAAAVPPATGDATFDDRFYFLTPKCGLPEPLIRSFIELPSPVMVSADRGAIRARLPASAPDDGVLATIRIVVSALRDAAADLMTDLVDTTFPFQHVSAGVWVARISSVWGMIEVVVGGGEDQPDPGQLAALEPFFLDAYTRIVDLRRNNRLGRLYRPVRVAVNDAGRIGVQFQHRIFPGKRVMHLEP